MLPSYLLSVPAGAPRFRAASPLPPLLRLAAWLSRRRYGKVLGIIPYVYGWLPALVFPHAALLRLAARRLPLSKRLRALVEVHVSRANGCTAPCTPPRPRGCCSARAAATSPAPWTPSPRAPPPRTRPR